MTNRKEKTTIDKAEIRIKIRVGNGAVGPGKINLLEQISQTGSISSAAKACSMDYRRAQYLLETMTEALGTTMVKTVVGGAQGGGAELTANGQALVKAFRSLDDCVRLAAQPDLQSIDKLLK